MKQTNNLSPLPIYTSIEWQNYRLPWSFGEIMRPYFCPANGMLPFQFSRTHSEQTDITVKLYDKAGNFILDVTSTLVQNGLEILQYPERGYDVIMFPGVDVIQVGGYYFQEGFYFLEITSGGNNWYSDVICLVRTSMEQYIEISWYDIDDLFYSGGQIPYSEGYRNKIYIKGEICRPEYDFEEEVTERDGYTFPQYQISKKTYKFTFTAPESMCDVMRLIRLSDFVTIKWRGLTYQVDSFLMTVTWEEQANIASVEVEFQTDTIVKKIGRGWIPTNKVDFNDDFNNDFNS